MNKSTEQSPASSLHVKALQLSGSDQPQSISVEPLKPGADIKLWMTYRECRMRQFTADAC